MTLAVWQDSFDVFLQVKNALVGFGYVYRLLPMTLDGKIVEGNVPDPQVQSFKHRNTVTGGIVGAVELEIWQWDAAKQLTLTHTTSRSG